MFTNAKTLAVAAALAVAGALPVAASAETQAAPPALPQAYYLNVVSSQEFNAGQYDGTMRLTVNPDGIINGTYQSTDQGGPKVVAGGVSPNGRVWLDIGRMHLVGTFVNGVLHTTSNEPYPDTLHVDAVVAPTR
jgi:hypothetical protein